MPPSLNSPMLAASDGVRAASSRMGSASARSAISASSEETALQFKQMLNRLDVAASERSASAKPPAPAPAPATQTSSHKTASPSSAPDRTAERLAERRSESQSQEQKLIARRINAQVNAKPAGVSNSPVAGTAALGSEKSVQRVQGEPNTETADEQRAEDLNETADSIASAPQVKVRTAESSGDRSSEAAAYDHDQGHASEDPADRALNGLNADDASRGVGLPFAATSLDGKPLEPGRPARRDSSAEAGSRRLQSTDPAQGQARVDDPRKAGVASPSADGATGASNFAALLPSSDAASATQALSNSNGQTASSSATATHAASGLEAMSRGPAADPLANSFGNSGGDTAQIDMRTPLHAPSFAPELSARLSLLAADGVQEAQLHLNPAELGPVAIQIVLEGQQAQISFHAEHAETRQVLEQGLPDLAAALRDAGLTLSGGGVFEQARDRSGQEPASDKDEAGRSKPARSITLDGASAGLAAVATSARRSQGVLDLYA